MPLGAVTPLLVRHRLRGKFPQSSVDSPTTPPRRHGKATSVVWEAVESVCDQNKKGDESNVILDFLTTI